MVRFDAKHPLPIIPLLRFRAGPLVRPAADASISTLLLLAPSPAGNATVISFFPSSLFSTEFSIDPDLRLVDNIAPQKPASGFFFCGARGKRDAIDCEASIAKWRQPAAGTGWIERSSRYQCTELQGSATDNIPSPPLKHLDPARRTSACQSGLVSASFSKREYSPSSPGILRVLLFLPRHILRRRERGNVRR